MKRGGRKQHRVLRKLSRHETADSPRSTATAYQYSYTSSCTRAYRWSCGGPGCSRRPCPAVIGCRPRRGGRGLHAAAASATRPTSASPPSAGPASESHSRLEHISSVKCSVATLPRRNKQKRRCFQQSVGMSRSSVIPVQSSMLFVRAEPAICFLPVPFLRYLLSPSRSLPSSYHEVGKSQVVFSCRSCNSERVVRGRDWVSRFLRRSVVERRAARRAPVDPRARTDRHRARPGRCRRTC